MFKMILLMAYSLAPFLPVSWPVFDLSACLTLLLLNLFGVKCTYSPLSSCSSAFRDRMNVQRLECVFVTHTLHQIVCVI